MRASAAALHSFGQTVAGLGIGSVLLGYLSDRLADSNFAGDYAAICLAAKPGQAPAACAEAAATGLQHAMMAVGGFLLIAIINYIFAARSLPWEMRGVGGQSPTCRTSGYFPTLTNLGPRLDVYSPAIGCGGVFHLERAAWA